MSKENFLMFLQQLITMTDKHDQESIEYATKALDAVFNLAKNSGLSDAITLRMMKAASLSFVYLLDNKKAFAGKKGAYQQNKIKRMRLEQTLQPTC